MPMMNQTTEIIYSLCAKVSLFSDGASESLAQWANQTGKRKRAEWRREHIIRRGMLARATHELCRALQPPMFGRHQADGACLSYADGILEHASKQIDATNIS